MDFAEHLEILADCCKQVFESMTGTAVAEVSIREDQRGRANFSFAQVIAYEHLEHDVKGQFVLGFPSEATALTVSSAISESIGLGEVEALEEGATDILQEFINTVVGRVLAGWDRLGLPTSFSPPRTVQNEELKLYEAAHTEAHLVILALDVGHVVFQVTFTEAVDDPLTGRTVLVVDDSTIIQKLLSKTLREVGLSVLTASNGREAIETFQRESPDLVIMDQVMPEMNGLEAVEAIHASDPGAAVLMLTSSARRDEILSARELGVLYYLLKPVESPRLLRAVRDALTAQPTA